MKTQLLLCALVAMVAVVAGQDAQCQAYNNNCEACSAVASIFGCGYCSSGSSAGQCRANMPAGCSYWAMPPESNQCSSGSSICGAYGSCTSCALVSGCGWCSTTNTCMAGTSVVGPTATGTCSSSSWVLGTSAGTYINYCSASGGGAATCSQYTSCDQCSLVSGCGWCGTTGQCVAGTSTFGPSTGSCSSASSQWTLGTSGGSYSYKCSSALFPGSSSGSSGCSSATTCATCSQRSGCGWCAFSSTSSSGTCMAGSSSFAPSTCSSGYTWRYGTCRTSSQVPCSSYSSGCLSCNSQSNCGWCAYPGSNTLGSCMDGANAVPFQIGSCPTGWMFSTSTGMCPASGAQGGGGGEIPGEPAGGIDGDKFHPQPGVYPSEVKPGIPLMIIIFISSIIGWTIFGCVGGLHPNAGAKVGATNAFSPFTSGATWQWVAIGVQFAAFALYIAAGAADSYSETQPDSSVTHFGVLSMYATGDASGRLYYQCSFNEYSTDDDKKFCLTWVVGAVMTLIYEVVGGIAALIALIFAFQTRGGNFVSNKVWSNTGVAMVAAIAGVFNWACTTHLCVKWLFQGAPGGLRLGASWGLLFCVVIINALLLVYWRAKLENTPKIGGAPAVAVVVTNSPAMYPSMGQPQQQYGQYPPQQQYGQYPPQQQYGAQPVAYGAPQQPQYSAHPPPQQQPAGGYVQEQPSGPAGFTQI